MHAPHSVRLWCLCFLLVVSTCVHCSTKVRPDSGAAGLPNAPPEKSSAANEAQDIGDFQPEEALGIGHEVHDPYKDRLYEVLFGGDHRRICQLLTVPSFEAESAVYIKSPVRGTPVVVSRALPVQLSQIEKREDRGPGRERADLGPGEYEEILAKIQPSTETHVAEIARTTVDTLSRACEAVLQRTHARGSLPGRDGTHHAAHWKEGTGDWQEGKLLSGQAWSPQPGTISSDYVAFGESLRRYASSSLSERDAIEADLLGRAERLIARAKPR
jgi:hypothetical protein